MSHAARRVLLVDDDLAIRGFLAEAFADEGLEVRSAANGEEALAALAAGWQPDLIVLDLMMPVMDGWTFRARQRELAGLEGVPVIVMSATRNLQVEAAAIGATAVFAKPFELEELLGVIRSTLGLAVDASSREPDGGARRPNHEAAGSANGSSK